MTADLGDRLCADRLGALLEGSGIAFSVFDSIDSTQTECRRRVNAGERGFAVLAEQQTAGRGRSGKSFFSPADAGLYFSFVPARRLEPAEAVGITAYAAVCAAEELRRLTGAAVGIKWVNDLFLDGRKVGGILTEILPSPETGTVDTVIVGIGLNLHPCAFPAELEPIAASLGCGRVKNELAAALIRALNAYAPGTDVMDRYRALSVVLGKTVRYEKNGVGVEAEAVAIDDAGGLIVASAAGRETLRAGEISVKI